VDRALQPGRAGAAEGFGKARPGAAGRGFVTIDRQRDNARVAQLGQQGDELDRLVGRLRAQQADAQTGRR